MNYRNLLKLLFIFITLFISVFFMFVTNQNLTIEYFYTAFLFVFILLDYILIIFIKKYNTKKSIYFVTGIILLLGIFNIYSMVCEYIDTKFVSFDSVWYYLLFLFIMFIDAMIDIKKKTNKLNDVLLMLVCLFISFIHYRYYMDSNFIHNMMKLPLFSGVSVDLSYSYHYVSQYYWLFIIILLVLFVHKKIVNIGIN